MELQGASAEPQTQVLSQLFILLLNGECVVSMTTTLLKFYGPSAHLLAQICSLFKTELVVLLRDTSQKPIYSSESEGTHPQTLFHMLSPEFGIRNNCLWPNENRAIIPLSLGQFIMKERASGPAKSSQ